MQANKATYIEKIVVDERLENNYIYGILTEKKIKASHVLKFISRMEEFQNTSTFFASSKIYSL